MQIVRLLSLEAGRGRSHLLQTTPGSSERPASEVALIIHLLVTGRGSRDLAPSLGQATGSIRRRLCGRSAAPLPSCPLRRSPAPGDPSRDALPASLSRALGRAARTPPTPQTPAPPPHRKLSVRLPLPRTSW